MVSRASARTRSRGRSAVPLPPCLRGREGRRGRLVLHLGRRAGRLPGAERRGKDDDPEGPLGSPLPDRGPGLGGRFPAPGARPRFPRADHAGDGSEAAAPLGPAAFGNVPPQPGHLRHPAQAVRRHDGRADRTARAGAAPGEARPAALARRADEVRAGRGVAAPAEGALSRRADHRARRLHAGYRARLRARVQRALRGDGAPDLALHGGRRRALPAGDGDRQGSPHLRRRVVGPRPPRPAGQADAAAALAPGGEARPGGARLGDRASGCGSHRASLAGRAPARRGARPLLAPAHRPHGRGSAARGSDARSLRAGARGVTRLLRLYPQLLRTGFAEAVAYRAEVLIWMCSTNMPLAMLAIWAAAARSGPVSGYSQEGFAAYYLAALLVRLMTGAWGVSEMTMEIRQGTLALRLLRPIHPLLQWSADNLAAIPMRGVVAIPVIAILLYVARAELAHDWFSWLLLCPALLGAWLLYFLVQAIIGTLALRFESAASLFDAWLGFSNILSGYLIPLDLFPRAVRELALVLPFRFQLSFPVELMLGRWSRAEALELLAGQWAYVALFLVSTRVAWRSGLRHYAAYGG